MSLWIKKQLLKWMLHAILGQERRQAVLDLVQTAEHTIDSAFGKRGYVYRELKKKVAADLPTHQLNLAVEAAVTLNNLLKR